MCVSMCVCNYNYVCVRERGGGEGWRGEREREREGGRERDELVSEHEYSEHVQPKMWCNSSLSIPHCLIWAWQH